MGWRQFCIVESPLGCWFPDGCATHFPYASRFARTTSYILGFFNKFESLKDGSLKTKIEALATKLKFPLSELYTIDGSKRSSHSNAYFFGIFRKRIVLFDTLLTQCNEEEVMAVLSHEIGHWSLNHVSKMYRAFF
jgi:STE24 endopeptidase